MSSRHTNTIRHTCPKCRGEVRRTWRRSLDRFASLFVPLYRYRCMTHQCEWEGNMVRQVNAVAAKSASGEHAVACKEFTAKSGSSLTRARFNWLSFAIPAGSIGSALVLVFMAMGGQSSAEHSNTSATEVKQLHPTAQTKDTTESGPVIATH